MSTTRNSFFSRLHHVLGLALAGQGEQGEAEACWQEALTISEQDPEEAATKQTTIHRRGRGDR